MTKLKKVSVISIESIKFRTTKLQKHWENVPHQDNYFYVHILFLLIGVMHTLPRTFFVTANAYWMYKFRNVTAEDAADASQRTILQSHFASVVTMSDSISNSVFVIFSSLLGYKVKARIRTLGTLAIMTVAFAITTLFVNIDTDSWQTPFFIIIVILLAAICGASAVLQIAVFVFLAKFPPHYMKIYLFGHGCASAFNAILQVLTLAVGTSTIESALIYFVLGTAIMGLTFVMFYFSKYNKFYMYYLEHCKEDTTRDMISFSQFAAILRIIWPALLIYLLMELVKIPQTPVTSLVVSENYGHGYVWNDVYFVPVITFMLPDLCSLMGRFVSSVAKAPSIKFILMFAFARVFLLMPLLFLCNAQPRNHLPVVFGYDWEYIIILATLSLSTGYLLNIGYLIVTRLMDPEKLEDGYMVYVSCICVIGTLLSPLSGFSVDFL